MTRYNRLIFLLVMTTAMVSPSLFAQVGTRQNPTIASPSEQIAAVAIENKFGDVKIVGWDRDTVEATAINTFTQKPLSVSRTEKSSPDGQILTVLIANQPVENGSVALEVKVPRGIKLEPVDVPLGSVSVSNIEKPVTISTNKGNIQINNAGTVFAQTVSGNISAENLRGSLRLETDKTEINRVNSNIDLKNIGGNVDIVTGKGVIVAQNIGGNVNLLTVHSRKIDFRCVKGRVEINDTHSLIALSGLEGDLDVMTSTGETQFTGEVFPGKRYRMKTLTGVVSMAIPETSGFTATVKTYQGAVLSEFDLQNELPPAAKNKRRLTGSYGSGRAGIELDSFSGVAELIKIAASEIKKCEP